MITTVRRPVGYTLAMFKYTFTTDSDDITTTTAWAKLQWLSGEEAPTGHTKLAPQLLSFWLTGTLNTSTGTVRVMFYDEVAAKKIGYVDLTMAATTFRASADNSSGDYLYTLASSLDGTNKVDILSALEKVHSVSSTGAVTLNAGQIAIYVGLPSANANTGTTTLYVAGTRCV